MEKIEEKAKEFIDYDIALDYDEGFVDGAKWGYTTHNDEVVKMSTEMDAEDGKSEDWYRGYFAFKSDLLTKLKEDKK